jgi:hypothetical protein
MEGRAQLRKKFEAANIGYESYRALIDSTINRKDDGIDIDERDGLRLAPGSDAGRLLSLFGDRAGTSAEWFIRLNPENTKGLDISSELTKGRTLFLTVEEELIDDELHHEVRVGIGTIKPQFTLDVEGTVAMRARVGTFKADTVPADKQWHTILSDADGLNDCQAYEIFAHIYDGKTERYSLTHAVILIAKGGKGERISITRVGSRYLWGRFLNRIKFRLKREYGKEVIQMRARDHYGFTVDGKPKLIFYRVTKIWDRQFENEGYRERRNVKQTMPKRIKIKNANQLRQND